MLKTSIDRFRLVGILEGISYIVLLFIAMPLKYIWLMPIFVKVIGMIHGILFMMYIYTQLEVAKKYNWGIKDNLIFLIASLVPFGTFFSDKKLISMKKSLE